MSERFFTDAEVIRIRQTWDDRTIDVRQTADDFGVSPETVRRIGRRDTYRHVGRAGMRSQDHRTGGSAVKEFSDQEVQNSLAKFLALQGGEKPAEEPPIIVKTGTSVDEVDKGKLAGYLGEERTEELRGNLFEE